MFTSKYFGSNDPDTGKILDGRWANLELPTVTTPFLESHGIEVNKLVFPEEEDPWYECLDASHVSSPYGLLRARWNYNPAPYVTRYNNINGVKDLSSVNTDTLQYYDGVDCSDYHRFIKKIKGESIVDFLSKVEDGTHGNLHFTIAGAGGDLAKKANDYLRENYNFNDNDIVVLARAGQKFFKYQLTEALTINDEFKIHAGTLPVICSNTPWDAKTESLVVSKLPGDANGPACFLNPAISQDEDAVNGVIETLFSDWGNTNPEILTKQRFLDLEFPDRVDALSKYLGRFQYEGDMASSAAAIDPVFWVAHGAIERLYQKLIFEDYLVDANYVSIGPDDCSGHAANGKKAWLQGFAFNDAKIDPTAVTNKDFISYLNPQSDFYRDNFNSVYDHSDWPNVCADDNIVLFKSTSEHS
jgi:hypothetical protein